MKKIVLFLLGMILVGALIVVIIYLIDQRIEDKEVEKDSLVDQEPAQESDEDDSVTDQLPNEKIDPFETVYTEFNYEDNQVLFDYPRSWTKTTDSDDYDFYSNETKNIYDMEYIAKIIFSDSYILPQINVFKLYINEQDTPSSIIDNILIDGIKSGTEVEKIYQIDVGDSVGYEVIYTQNGESIYSKEKLIVSNNIENDKKLAYLMQFLSSNDSWELYNDLAIYIFSTFYVQGVERTNTENPDIIVEPYTEQ